MGHALVLDTGAGTHFTVVYFRKNKIDAVIIGVARTFCAERGLTVGAVQVGPMWGANSILVSGELASLKTNLTNHFNQLGYDVDLSNRGQTAHINIRGDKNVVSKLRPHADLINGWSGM